MIDAAILKSKGSKGLIIFSIFVTNLNIERIS